MPSNPSNAAASGKKSTRRPRAIQACNLCRTKKYKCDGNIPCAHCRRQSIECIYQGAPKQESGHYSFAYARKLERRLAAAEAALLSQGLFINEELETCLVDGHRHNGSERQSGTYLTPRNGQLPTPETLLGEQYTMGDHSLLGEPPTADSVVHDSSETTDENGNTEVMDINTKTHGFEFHGQTSSIAFLERLRKCTESTSTASDGESPEISSRSLVTDFNNNSFVDQHERPSWLTESDSDEFYPLEAYTFIEAYFNHQHYIYPIVEKEPFLFRCRELWSGHAQSVTRSCKAMYFALLALGALTRTWNEETINGMGRDEWTRLLFKKAEHALGRPGSFLNLLSIQALFIMAKVCQYQLDLNLAYTYLGMAIRIALSCGINRLAIFRVRNFPQDSPTLIVARTWWALYALEIELSFALGRPDTLGSDFHHNRPIPRVDDSECTIIGATMDLSMIIRDISTSGIYLTQLTLPDRLFQAQTLERRLNDWLVQLPVHIQPTSGTDVLNSGSIRDPQWSSLQKLVLKIRHLHVMTVLFHPFFQYTSKTSDKQSLSPEVIEAAEKCIDSAVTMIRTIYDTYRMHHFMRTWWYNTVYLSFGMSVLLFYEARRPFPSTRNHDLLHYVDQALDALEAMEECAVARKIGAFAHELVNVLQKQRQQGEGEIDPAMSHEHHIVPQGSDLYAEFPDFNDLFPEYLGPLEDFAESRLFDPGFSNLDPAMVHGIGLSDSSIYPSPAIR